MTPPKPHVKKTNSQKILAYADSILGKPARKGTAWEKEFRKTLPKDFDVWLFCWNGEEADSSFDCACCISGKHEKDCNCICHERIKQIKALLKTLLSSQKAEIVRRVEEAMKKIEALKYNEPLDSEMRVVNMIANSANKIIKSSVLEAIKE